ncbi:rod shape-determining protein MreC [Brevundimonas sp. S30B]|uniref:rod shape-determining protein MreC n=1 Tax=unclassified Brevundimonas TaxID=2622653 RepID=UPI001071C1D3|nr:MULTISPECIES: rod shape-determining protein MreC [unclassified Brevundimonas]QBX37639.1 rod shape-determining protein MreC [Brevundimonas sp. MF30-B]TFW03568.1 rod shape-determining protein MreC [Brevundimonas sp. S30B]
MAFRDGPFENLKVPLAWTAAVMVVVALIVAGMLLIGDRPRAGGQESYAGARSVAREATTPVGRVLSAPVRWTRAAGAGIGGYFFAASENRRLKAEIRELEAWRDEAIALKSVNARYEALLGVRTEPPIPMVTARTVTEARGPFSNARLLDVGSRRQVRIGNPVVDEHGLVGRVIGVSPNASRMLMLTDVASKTPVLIERTGARALMVGDGSGGPRLDYVRGDASMQAGDRVLTSGDGGALPRGLPVGVVASGVDGRWRVKLFSDRGPIDYVRVLLFQDFSQLADTAALNAPPLVSLDTAPAPTAAQATAIADVAARRQAAAQAAAERVRTAQAAPSPQPLPTPPAGERPAPTAPRPSLNAQPAQTQPQAPPEPAPDGDEG